MGVLYGWDDIHKIVQNFNPKPDVSFLYRLSINLQCNDVPSGLGSKLRTILTTPYYWTTYAPHQRPILILLLCSRHLVPQRLGNSVLWTAHYSIWNWINLSKLEIKASGLGSRIRDTEAEWRLKVIADLISRWIFGKQNWRWGMNQTFS